MTAKKKKKNFETVDGWAKAALRLAALIYAILLIVEKALEIIRG